MSRASRYQRQRRVTRAIASCWKFSLSCRGIVASPAGLSVLRRYFRDFTGRLQGYRLVFLVYGASALFLSVKAH